MINSASFHKYLEEILGLGTYLNHQRLTGGDINDAYSIDFTGGKVFLKTKSDVTQAFFEAEADGLQALHSAQSQLHVPQVLACDQFEGQAFLALEFIEEGPKSDSFASNFGRGLAALHQKEADAFGWPKSNYIGSLLQRNDRSSSWTDFYFSSRLEPLFSRAFDSAYVNRRDKKALTGLVYHLDALLPQESPALIHGDLWAGNHLCTKDGKGVLIDPAVYYGHREMDLAMMLLFGGYGQETFSSYQEEHPLEPGFEERVPIHQLYPLLVHLYLFGSSYLGSCREVWMPFL